MKCGHRGLVKAFACPDRFLRLSLATRLETGLLVNSDLRRHG